MRTQFLPPKTSSYVLRPGLAVLPDGPAAGRAIVVDGSTFTYVGDSAALPEMFRDLEVIDLPDHVVMPGMIDAHNHMSQPFAKSFTNGEPSQLWKRMWVPLSGAMTEYDYYRAGLWTALELLNGGFTGVAASGEPSDARGRAALRGILESGIRVVYGVGVADRFDYHSKAKQAGEPPTTAEALRTAEEALNGGVPNSRATLSVAAGTIHTATPDLLVGLSNLAKEAGVIFQFHANEHIAEVEFCIEQHGKRPIELLESLGVVGPHVLLAHCTLITAREKRILADTGTGVSYNPVASAWKGNAIAPANDFRELGVRFGLGTDATRNDAFRLLDAAETAQRLTHSMGVIDFVASGGRSWVQAGTAGSADVTGLGDTTGAIRAGLHADYLILNPRTLSVSPVWDLEWDLVRYFDRSNIEAVAIDGTIVHQKGQSTIIDETDLVSTELDSGVRTIRSAPVHKVLDITGTGLV